MPLRWVRVVSQACLVGCIGTGAQDDCRVGYNLSGNLAGAVNLDVWAYPVPIVQFGTTVVSVWTWKEKYADGRSPETSAGIWTLDSISMTRT